MERMLIEEAFREFAKLLEDRFHKGTFTTEDSIRYTFFYCLSNYGNLHPSEIILEYPHPSISNAKVDTYIPPKNNRFGLVFEFKFDRAIPSAKTAPRPQKAGKIFMDIMRLTLFPSHDKIRRYFVYVTDEEMASYFQNKHNQLNDFFNLMPQQTLRVDKAYINRHSMTFVKSVGTNIVPCEIMCLLSKEFQRVMWLRVYEIKPIVVKGT